MSPIRPENRARYGDDWPAFSDNIRPENRARYGDDWPAFSDNIRFVRAAGRCECVGECGRGTHAGRCPNRHGEPAAETGSPVVLTVAHLCHTPECRDHVRAMCQGCHLHYDRAHHAESAARNAEALGQTTLIERPPVARCPSVKDAP